MQISLSFQMINRLVSNIQHASDFEEFFIIVLRNYDVLLGPCLSHQNTQSFVY